MPVRFSLLPCGARAPTPLAPPLLPVAFPARSAQPMRISLSPCLHTANPPSARSGMSAVPDHSATAVRVRRFPVPPVAEQARRRRTGPVPRAPGLLPFHVPVSFPPTGIVPVWSRPTPPGPVWHHQIPRNSRVAALHAIPHSFPLRPAVRKKGMHQVSLYLFAYNKTKWCVLEQNASAAILSCTCQSDRVIATRWSGASVPGMAYRGEQEAGKC